MTWQCGWENAQKECEAVLEPRVILSIYLFQPLRERVQKNSFSQDVPWTFPLFIGGQAVQCSMQTIFFLLQGTGHNRDQFLEGAQGLGETILYHVKLSLTGKWISEAQLFIKIWQIGSCLMITEMFSPIHNKMQVCLLTEFGSDLTSDNYFC